MDPQEEIARLRAEIAALKAERDALKSRIKAGREGWEVPGSRVAIVVGSEQEARTYAYVDGHGPKRVLVIDAPERDAADLLGDIDAELERMIDATEEEA